MFFKPIHNVKMDWVLCLGPFLVFFQPLSYLYFYGPVIKVLLKITFPKITNIRSAPAGHYQIISKDLELVINPYFKHIFCTKILSIVIFYQLAQFQHRSVLTFEDIKQNVYWFHAFMTSWNLSFCSHQIFQQEGW